METFAYYYKLGKLAVLSASVRTGFRLLDNLPPEVILVICDHLSSTDLCTISRTSPVLNTLSMPLIYQRGVVANRPPTTTPFQWIPTPNRSTLHFAAAHNNIPLLTALISRLGTRTYLLDARDAYGLTPLVSAILYNKTSAVRILLAAGASVECTTTALGSAWTPLHCAVAMGHLMMAVLLITAGADPERRDAGGLTPLQVLSLTLFGAELYPAFQKLGLDETVLDKSGLAVQTKCRVLKLLRERKTCYPLTVDEGLARLVGVDIRCLDTIVRSRQELSLLCMRMLAYEEDRCKMCMRHPIGDMLPATASRCYHSAITYILRRPSQSDGFDMPDELLLAKELAMRGRPINCRRF